MVVQLRRRSMMKLGWFEWLNDLQLANTTAYKLPLQYMHHEAALAWHKWHVAQADD